MIDSRVPRRLRRLIVLALQEGWRVEISPDVQLTLRKPGFTPIQTGPRANDARVLQRSNGDEPDNG
ncbi:hypothetical protein [Pseudomonas sp. S3E17]|uniref:hypothetical protein n=1 Tax=Pseudomonas sp. S3E17 TaxID=2817893 RepID=UPI0020A07424|nr:hypothetical protein [Pseudomonas sp. S3E17]MCP1463290.1 hypothetical protein [Pseudomonas sp. S3E17]